MRKDWRRFAALALATAVLVGEVPQNVLSVSAQEQQTEVSVEAETAAQEESDVAESEETECTEQTTTTQETESDSEKESETLNDETASESEMESVSEETQSETENLSEEVSTSQESPETEEPGTEETEVETEEMTEQMELNASSADFVIENGVLKQYKGSDEEVTIPNGVVTIGANVFIGNTKIKKVILSSSVKNIGDSAFQNCSNLYQVELNEGLTTIGKCAFEKSPLGKLYETGKVEPGTLTIPATVQSIGWGAFTGCIYLGEVKFLDGENKTLQIGSAFGFPVFGNCENLTRVDFPDRLEVVPESAFRGCTKLKDVIFGSGTKTIANEAFYGCSSLKPVKFNDGLVKIERDAFFGVAFGEVFDTGRIEYGTITIPASVQYINNGAFTKCKYLKEVIFEDGQNDTLEIASNYGFPTFGRCGNLSRVDLPERLTTIPDSMFSDDTALNEILLGGKTEIIGAASFYSCSSLKDITFPKTLKTISDKAFGFCTSLKAPKLNEGLKTIGDDAFARSALGEKLENGKIELGTLTIPSTVQSIGWGAFSNCNYLGEVIFADGDTVVLDIKSTSGFPVFGSCQNLMRVDFPERLETIPEYAFYQSGNLKEVVFGKNTKTISNGAFKGCQSLGDVKFNEGLKMIGSEAFFEASLGKYNSRTGKIELGTLTIPSTVQNIGSGAFCRCPYLEKVIFANGETVVLNIESGAWSALERCENLTTVILPERIQYLSASVFRYSEKLKTLYIPQGVTKIDGNLLDCCPNVTIYGVPGSVAEEYANKYKIPFKNKDQLKIDDDDPKPEQADSKPNIDDSKCIINLNSDAKRGILSIYPSNGYTIDVQSLAIKKADGTDSQFTIAKVDGSATQYAVTGSNLTKGTYKVVLYVKTSAGEQQPYKIPFTIQVVDKHPQVKVTQETLQLYRKDGRGKVLMKKSLNPPSEMGDQAKP